MCSCYPPKTERVQKLACDDSQLNIFRKHLRYPALVGADGARSHSKQAKGMMKMIPAVTLLVYRDAFALKKRADATKREMDTHKPG